MFSDGSAIDERFAGMGVVAGCRDAASTSTSGDDDDG